MNLFKGVRLLLWLLCWYASNPVFSEMNKQRQTKMLNNLFKSLIEFWRIKVHLKLYTITIITCVSCSQRNMKMEYNLVSYASTQWRIREGCFGGCSTPGILKTLSLNREPTPWIPLQHPGVNRSWIRPYQYLHIKVFLIDCVLLSDHEMPHPSFDLYIQICYLIFYNSLFFWMIKANVNKLLGESVSFSDHSLPRGVIFRVAITVIIGVNM